MPLTRARPFRGIVAALALALGLSVMQLTGGSAMASPSEPASASEIRPMADLSLFRPGNLMSNAVFFDSSSMSEAQISTFLRQRVPTCQAGYTCLKDFSQNTTSRAADSYCSAYSGASGESAARIVWKVAQACGINPQVLLATLQKEQGLVTHTWPSDWRYTIAMGQGCPDTAACDTRYYGFFNQVYGAARQFRIYTEGRYFTYYAPGRTWNLRFHPNTACGTSPVYIENQATANLYYYTPYQPNAAALRAGYGEGDSCSSYGNRNFYQYFTDWFGSTQNRVGALIQGAGRGEVYLVSAGTKHRVSTYDDLTVFRSRLGAVSSVATRYVDELPTGSDIGRYVHDPRTGTLYLLEGDGTKHRFANVDQIALFGYPFNSYVNLEPRLIDAFATGGEVAAFIRSTSGPEIYVLEAGLRRNVYNPAAWAEVSRGTPGYVATMRPAAADLIPIGPTRFASNTLVRAASSNDVLLATPDDPLIHIPSFALAAEFGATVYITVPDVALSRNAISPSALTAVVSCGGVNYIAVAGKLVAVAASDVAGLAVSTPTAAQCAMWSKSSGSLTPPLFVQPKGKGEIYVVESGKLRHVRAYAQLMQLNGQRPLSLINWSIDTAMWVGIGAPYLADGSVVQFAGAPEVYVFRVGELHHVTSYPALIALGGGRVPPIESLPLAAFASYTVGAPID